MKFSNKHQHQLANRNRSKRLSTSLLAAGLMLALAGTPAGWAGDPPDHDAKHPKEEDTAEEKAAAADGGGARGPERTEMAAFHG